MVLFVALCSFASGSDSVPRKPTLLDRKSVPVEIIDPDQPVYPELGGSPRAAAGTDSLKNIDPRTICVANALVQEEEEDEYGNKFKFIDRLRDPNCLEEIEIVLKEQLDATKRKILRNDYDEPLTAEEQHYARKDVEMVELDLNKHMEKFKEAGAKFPEDTIETTKSGCCARLTQCMKSTIDKGLITEVTGFFSSAILGIAACNVIVHKYYAPAALWTISEGLSRFPREFTVPGFTLAATTGIIGGYLELYKGMLGKLGVDSADEVRCCGWCGTTNKRIKQIQLGSMVVGALSMIPTALFRTGYKGEKSIHTLCSVGVFQAVTATASCLHIFFSQSKDEKIRKYKAITGMLINFSTMLLGTLALKKFGGFKGETMSHADCELIYSAEVCSQRNAKTYTGIPQVLQFGFALAEHMSLGTYIVTLFTLNALLHPNNGTMSRYVGLCVEKVVEKLPKCCSRLDCGINSCVKPKRVPIRELEEGVQEDEEKKNKWCSWLKWSEWCTWNAKSPEASPSQNSEEIGAEREQAVFPVSQI